MFHTFLLASEIDRKYLDKAYKADNRLSLPYILSTSMVGILYLSFPIAKSSYEYLAYGNTTWVMPMRSMYNLFFSHRIVRI